MAQSVDGAVERYEQRSEKLRKAQEDVTQLAIEPVVAALKRATKNDPEMQTLLGALRVTATPHIYRSANAYARRERRTSQGGTVEVDLGWWQQALAISRIEVFRLLDPRNERQLAYRAGFEYGQAIFKALRSGERLPNFTFNVAEYVTDPLERSFVDGLGSRFESEATAWVVLHEIAHHKLGHLAPEHSKVSHAVSRQMELDADAWASRKMVELNIPLYGVMIFMNGMIGIEQVQHKLGLALPEEDNTHPSWQRRKDQLQRAHDPLAGSGDKWLMFHSRLNLASRGMPADVKPIAYAFPRDPLAIGTCLGIVQVGGVQEFAFVERQERSVHLYQATPEELIDVHVIEPDRPLTQIRTTVMNRATGQKAEGNLLAWQQAFALFGERESEGMRVAELIEFSARSLYETALERFVPEPTVRRAVMTSFDRKTSADCEIGIAFGKGNLDMRELVSRSEAANAKHAQEMTFLLGAAGYARFRSEMLAHPLAQKGLRVADKILPRYPAVPRDPTSAKPSSGSSGITDAAP